MEYAVPLGMPETPPGAVIDEPLRPLKSATMPTQRSALYCASAFHPVKLVATPKPMETGRNARSRLRSVIPPEI